MKSKLLKRISCCSLALFFSLAVAPNTFVGAHGHHGSHHSNSSYSQNYYYCGGHEAHYHNGGVCPYDDYYYCGGHEAHYHNNGVCPYDTPTYSDCSVTKSQIKKIQKSLNKLGYSCGTADGICGTKTRKALTQYQEDNDLTANGSITKKVLKLLDIA